ncbi:MAG: FkbM family methyltransferase, partial [Isosphaeraceae bacterium]
SRDAVNRPRETLGDSHLISSDPRSRFGLVCDLLCCRGNTRLKIAGARLLYKVATSVVGKSKRIIKRGGIAYEVDLSEGIDLSLFLFGGYQKHVLRNKFAQLRPDSVVFDVGANFGTMTLEFARACPRGKVFAFEPTHYALARLKRNLELNPDLAGRVEVINSFVTKQSSANPSIVAYSSWKVDGGRTGKEHPVHLGTPQSADGVPAISLDDFCSCQQLQRVDFIKIDTDGHEHEVLLGAHETIGRYRPLVLFEIGQYVMDESNISFGFYYDFFNKLNYSLFDTKTSRPVSPDDYRGCIPAQGTTDLIAVPQNRLDLPLPHRSGD